MCNNGTEEISGHGKFAGGIIGLEELVLVKEEMKHV